MKPFKELVIIGSDINDAGKFDQKKRDAHLNASEAMTCIRKQWYQKNGAEQTPQDWGYARRGTHGEKFLVESLIAANVPLEYTGRDQLSLQDEKRKISSTPDGVIKYDDVWVVPEFKTIDPRTNRGNYHDIAEFPVPRNKAILDQMAKRAAKILRTKDVANLDREGKRNGGKECQTMCSFKGVCGVNEEKVVDRTRANRGSNMDAGAIRYMELKDMEDGIKVEKAAIAEDIKNGLVQRNTNKVMVGNIEVSLAVAKGRASLDKKLVAAAGIDLSPFETIGAPSERLTVKRA